MNKKTVLACLLACSALVLTQCITKKNNPSGDTSDTSSHSGEGDEVQLTLDTGKTSQQNGQLQFAADSESVEGEVVHLAYDAAESKTTIYGLDAGAAKLTDGTKTYLVSVNYGIYKGTGEVSVALGNDYLHLENLASPFRGSKTEAYVAGSKNAFKVDAGLRYKTFTEEAGAWELDEKVANFDALDAAHLYDADNVKIELSNANYGTVNADLTVSFSEAAVGQTVTVSAYANGQKVEQVVKVNAGYNVYDSDGFRALFENPAIHGELNILRSFEAKVENYQLFTSGGKTYLYNTVGSDKEPKYQGSVYFREDEAAEVDPLVINGNYMVLDATEVPQHYNGNVKELTDIEPVEWRGATAFDMSDMKETQAGLIQNKVCNPQEGIFRASSHNTPDGKGLVFNNWNIRGNSNTGSEDNPALESTGENNLVLQSYNFTANNCIFDLGVYGIAVYDARATALCKDTIIQNTWGSSICTWRGHRVELQNSLLTNAGSAAVWLINDGNVEGHEGNLIVDANSVIDNYLSTSSAWFTAYGLTALGVFADSIENAVNQPATGHAHSIYKSATNKVFNFEVLVQTESDNASAYPFANVSLNGAASVIDPTAYGRAGYVSAATDPKAYVKGIYDNQNSIVKCIGQTDTELGTSIYQTLPAVGNDVATAYAVALATALATQEAAGRTAHIQVDAALQGGLSAIISVRPVSA